MRQRTIALLVAVPLVLATFSANATGNHHGNGWGNHGPKFDWVFFPAPQPGLKCRKVVIFIPKWNSHWLASFGPGFDDDDDRRRGRGHKRFKKVIGFLCKVPVSRF